MTKITQIYIGLETSNTNTEIEPQEVIDRISRHVDAGTFHETKGLWKGELENSLMFECVNIRDHLKEYGDVHELKERLETVFNQDSVMVKQCDAEVWY